jgi:NADH-quinone oxidoreductase subunit N
MSWSDVSSIAPILWTTLAGVAVLLYDAFVRKGGHGALTFVAVLFLIPAAWTARQGLTGDTRSVFEGALSADPFASFFNLTFLVVALITIAVGSAYFARERRELVEFYPLVLFATVGMMVMAAATDLVTIFLGLETMSVSLYVLAAIQRRSMESNEAGFKYLILGAFSSAFLLYGMAMLYGTTGTTNLPEMKSIILGSSQLGDNVLFWLGWGLMLVGLGFKVAMVPFHMWTPDVYDGSPAPVAGFMAAGVKAASFAAMLRVVWTGLPELAGMWSDLLMGLAVVTMVVGNVIALAQTNLKRMLAYSAIAHAGYLLVGVVASSPSPEDGAARGVLFYVLAYALMNLGAFALVTLVSSRDGEHVQLSGYAGLARRHPAIAAAMAVFMLSLAGIPPTAGFWGKLYVFQAAVQSGHVALAVIALLNSAVAMFYYLRVVVTMYMREATDEAYVGRDPQVGFAMVALAVAILWIGLFPGPMADLARAGTAALSASF